MSITEKNGLKISSNLFNFINNEVLPGTDILPDKFWDGFEKAVHELSPINKKLIKKGDVHSRRQVLKHISHKPTVRELFNVIAPSFSKRNGGYTRITKLGFRDNDCAPISVIEFVDMVSDTVLEPKSEK